MKQLCLPAIHACLLEGGVLTIHVISDTPTGGENSWTTFLSDLKARGLKDVAYVVSDSHEGLKHAIAKVLPMALWQRCAVHFMRNAYDHASHQTDPACLAELKRMWSCADMAHARDELDRWIRRWGEAPGCEKLVTWVEENIEETFSAYRLPPAHRTRMKSTNMLERYNEEIRRRTRVIRIFPNEPACLRLIRALAVETHDQWVSGKRYLSGWIGLEKEPVQPTMKLRKAA